MRKHLIVTLLLTCGMPFSASMSALAAPAPQPQSQSTVAIKGQVLDENDEPVIGASVTPKGQKQGVITDAFGNFVISAAPGTQLEISFVGYQTVTVKAAQGMTVYLDPTTEVLNQLVVVGYGSQKRANLTGAVATVDVSRTMENRPVEDVAKALQGAVPGLTILNNTGNITGNPVVQIRGTGTLTNGGGSPLYVVDGVAMDDISYLNPEEIKEISVLKDASSSSIYGSRAAFGVILITTKSGEKVDRVQVKYSNNFGWSQAASLPEINSTVSSLYAMNEAANMQSANSGEFFGQYYSDIIPYAEMWEKQNGGGIIKDYQLLHQYVDDNNVGDYRITPSGGIISYANYDLNAIMVNNAAPSSTHNASISGSSGRVSYNMAFGYASRQSLLNFNPDKVKRYNVNTDINVDVTSWLKAGARILFSQRDITTLNYGQNTWGSVWRFPGFYQMLGYAETADGTYADFRNLAYLKQAAPIETDYQYTRMQAYMRAEIIKGLSLNADFTYAIRNVNSAYAYLPVEGIDNWYGPFDSTKYLVQPASTTATKNNTKETRWSFNAYATYDFNVAKNNNFKIMLGANAERNLYGYFQARTKQLLDVNLPAMNLYTGDLVAPSNSDSHWATAGFFGRINYDYKGIYLAEFNGRYDGSSRFPAADQWAFFSSGSIGYRFSEENYFKPLKSWWSNGKLRASYGEIGNEAVGTNRFISTISTQNISYIDHSTGILMNTATMPTLVSSTLTWERICTTDIGLDLGFMNNTLNASFDWFQRDTKDMLAPGTTLPAVLGASAPYGNNGSLRTRGWELSLNWNRTFGDWELHASFNIADSKTTVTKWTNPSNSLTSNFSGERYGAIYGLETARYYTKDDFEKDANGNFIKTSSGAFVPKAGVTNQQSIENASFHYGPGDIMYVDQDGDGRITGGLNGMYMLNGKFYVPTTAVPSDYQGTTIGNATIVDDATYAQIVANENAQAIGVGTRYNHGDIKTIGNNLPRYEYGFHVGGAWKGIDLDIFCQGVGKRDMWTVSSMVIPFAQAPNDIYYKGYESHNSVVFDANYNIVDYVVDQSNKYPRLWPGGYASNNIAGISLAGTNNYIPQTKYLQDISYLRVKNVTVGYTLPYAWTSKAYIQRARIYFSGENLFFIHRGNRGTGFDPEIVTTEWSGGNTVGRANPIPRTYSFGMQITF